ncbi:uncharacterized protein LOC34623699 [Cyclospora cayetanensis]|uniref:Uncharacterized protein LOC34623699 n=1 Tax=Cyclospora cayetanensis TaxID=88456 RepID=A0A6P6RQ52_9EIME|nr:uncharacterized protein LOC34623699 [Cyclospora cayetanensis]
MSSLRDAFKEGEIPQELCTHCVKNNEGLTGEWTIIADHRSDGLREITEFFGLDPRDRTAWEFSLHLNAPRLLPHAPLRHMASGCEDGTFLAAEIDGILFVKYEMRRGTFYITRILLDRDPSSKERGPITLAQYCVITKDGEKHVAHRYHKRVEGRGAPQVRREAHTLNAFLLRACLHAKGGEWAALRHTETPLSGSKIPVIPAFLKGALVGQLVARRQDACSSASAGLLSGLPFRNVLTCPRVQCLPLKPLCAMQEETASRGSNPKLNTSTIIANSCSQVSKAARFPLTAKHSASPFRGSRGYPQRTATVRRCR